MGSRPSSSINRRARCVATVIVSVASMCGLTGLSTQAAAEGQTDWARAREHWAFRVPTAHAIPPIKQGPWPRHAFSGSAAVLPRPGQRPGRKFGGLVDQRAAGASPASP